MNEGDVPYRFDVATNNRNNEFESVIIIIWTKVSRPDGHSSTTQRSSLKKILLSSVCGKIKLLIRVGDSQKRVDFQAVEDNFLKVIFRFFPLKSTAGVC